MIFELWHNPKDFTFTLLPTREDADDKDFYDQEIKNCRKLHQFEAYDLYKALKIRNEYLGWI
jgi:hypothetical protein